MRRGTDSGRSVMRGFGVGNGAPGVGGSKRYVCSAVASTSTASWMAK